MSGILILCFLMAAISTISYANIYVTTPLSNSTGYCYSNRAPSVLTVTETSLGIDLVDARVDTWVNELRALGQKAPNGVLMVDIFVGNPFVPAISKKLFHAMLDTTSTWNIATQAMMNILQFPLGSHCHIMWGDSGVIHSGRFVVLNVEAFGTDDEVIFCYVPSATNIIVNRDFLGLKRMCQCTDSVMSEQTASSMLK